MEVIGSAISAVETLLNSMSGVKETLSLLNCESELESVQETIRIIERRMLDADQRIRYGFPISAEDQGYLEKMKEAVGEAEDLLDEFSTRIQLQQHSREEISSVFRRKVWSLLSPFQNMPLKRSIKKMKTDLDEVVRNAPKFKTLVDKMPIRKMQETWSLVNEASIVGRKEDRNKITGMLLDPNVQGNVLVLSIVGVGGLGKTTLAQLVYNDPRIKTEFPGDGRIWVCVSDEGGSSFDAVAMVDKIIGGASTGHNLGLEAKLEPLKKKLNRGKFLLVLDDVWTEDPHQWLKFWDILSPLAPNGSKVVVTTRSNATSKAVGSAECTHNLQGLPAEYSWSLFEMVVGIEEANRHDLVEMGKDIVKRCAGVPLAIRVVASLLRGQDKDAWRCFHRNGFTDGIREDNDIMKILKFSYYNLPHPLKACFTYCALFPKDREISKEKLIGLWMAQGYVKEESRSQSLEDVAEGYFQILLQRCFFQDVRERVHFDESKGVVFKIHDLMHDVAQQVAGKEIFIAHSGTSRPDEKIRHFFEADPYENTEGFVTRTKIRSYIHDDLDGWDIELIYPEKMLLTNWRRLRALDLSGMGIRNLPDEIGELLHLRYLDLNRNYNLKMLPVSFTKLINLQTLDLDRCGLKELPNGFSKLVNLRALKLCNDLEEGSFALNYMPIGMGSLSCLSRLNGFVLAKRESNLEDDDDDGGLKDLSGLRKLKGSFTVWISETYEHVEEDGREGGYLSNKEYLDDIAIMFPWVNKNDLYDEDGEFLYDHKRVGSDEALLEGLQPPRNLKKLTVYCYSGRRIPSWARGENLATLLPNLVEIVFSNWEGVLELPCLGKLPHLKKLRVAYLDNLEYIGKRTMWDDGSSNAAGADTSHQCCSSSFYPSLEQLYLRELPKLKGWWGGSFVFTPNSSGTGGDKIVRGERSMQSQVSHRLPSFPRLSHLEISECYRLTTIPLCPTVETLVLGDGQTGKGRYLNSIPGAPFQFLPTLIIWWDNEVESLWEFGEVFRSCSSSLRKLTIEKCIKLRSVSGGLEYATALESLELRCLPELTFDETEEAQGEQDGQRTSLPWQSFGQRLQSLRLDYLDKLVHLPKWIGNLSSLRDLGISNCKGLESLPEAMRNLTSLEKLDLVYLNPRLMERCRIGGEDWPKIQHIPHISFSPR